VVANPPLAKQLSGVVSQTNTIDGDGGGFGILAAHLSSDDLVAFADGLEPRDGGGWEATVLPQGMTEVDLPGPARPESELLESSWDSADAHYELFTYEGGAATFHSCAPASTPTACSPPWKGSCRPTRRAGKPSSTRRPVPPTEP
jgi:hypothetical protein